VKIKKSRSFFCSALSRVDDPEGNLVPQLAPPGSNTTDPAVIQKIFDDAAGRVAAGWVSREDVRSQRQRANRRGKVCGRHYTARENLQGKQVVVDSNGRIHFW